MPTHVTSASKTNTQTYLPSTKKVAIVAALVIITGFAVYMAVYRPDLAYKMLSWKVAGGTALVCMVTLLGLGVIKYKKNAPLIKISNGKASNEHLEKFFSKLTPIEVEKAFATKDENDWRKTRMPFIRPYDAGVLTRKFGKDKKWLEAMVKGIGHNYERMGALFSMLYISKNQEKVCTEITSILREQKWLEALLEENKDDAEEMVSLLKSLHSQAMWEFCKEAISILRAQGHLAELLLASNESRDLSWDRLLEYLEENEVDILAKNIIEGKKKTRYSRNTSVSSVMDLYVKKWSEKHVDTHKTLNGIVESLDELFGHISHLSKDPSAQAVAMFALTEKLDPYISRDVKDFSVDETDALITTILDKLESFFKLGEYFKTDIKAAKEFDFPHLYKNPITFLCILRLIGLEEYEKRLQHRFAHLGIKLIDWPKKERTMALIHLSRKEEPFVIKWMQEQIQKIRNSEDLENSSECLYTIYQILSDDKRLEYFSDITGAQNIWGHVEWKINKSEDAEKSGPSNS